jgi:DNA-binding NtrC family response regulator
MITKKIFIVDDDKFYINILEAKLNAIGDFDLEKFHTGQDCINNSYKQPQIIFLDYILGDTSGLEVLKEIKSTYPNVHIVMLSGQKEMKIAISLLKYGATDYLLKDLDDTERRLSRIIHNCEKITNSRENKQSKNKVNFFHFLF